jgi:hypothetical protein
MPPFTPSVKQMKWFHGKRWGRTTICVVVVLLAVIISAASYLDIRSRKDVIAYIGMSQECHPVWKDLALKRIRAGQTVEDVNKTRKPQRSESWDRYTLLMYNDIGDFTGLVIVARDHKLIFAGASSCGWEHEFFSTISRQELQEIYRSYWDYIKEKKRRKKALQQPPR